MPPIDAGLLSAGSNFLGSVVNTVGQGIQNKKSRKFALQMYNRQNADNLSFWNLQNQYNSPQQQMKRLQDAGLNPHLVYGGSSGGTAGTAGSLSAPSPQTPKFDNTRPGDSLTSAGRGYIDNYLSTEIKDAQLDNLKKENELKTTENALKKSQVLNTLTNNARGKFDLKFEQKMLPYSSDARREIVRQMSANTQSTLDSNDRQNALQSYSIQQAVENILSSRANRAKTQDERRQIEQQIKNLKTSNQLQELDRNLKQEGVQPHDKIWWRVLGQNVAQNGGIKNTWDKTLYKLLFGG